jgi:hypothetical protein
MNTFCRAAATLNIHFELRILFTVLVVLLNRASFITTNPKLSTNSAKISQRVFKPLVTFNTTSNHYNINNEMPLLSRISRPLTFISKRYAGHPTRVFAAALKTIFFVHVVYQYGYVISPTQGASMLPTLEVVGDHVLIDRGYRRGDGIMVGDIVSFDSVVEPRERVIKRVLGLPGDYVLRGTPGESETMIQVSTVLARLSQIVGYLHL